MIKFFKRFFYQKFPRYQQLEARCVCYPEANTLLMSNPEWRIDARCEDKNRVVGVVFLERVKRILE